MFLKKELFNPTDTDYSNIPEKLYQKHKQKYIKNAIKLLEKEGCTIITPTTTFIIPTIPSFTTWQPFMGCSYWCT